MLAASTAKMILSTAAALIARTKEGALEHALAPALRETRQGGDRHDRGNICPQLSPGVVKPLG